MSRILRPPPTGQYKPSPWNVDLGLLDPEYRALWRGLVWLVVPGLGWQQEIVSGGKGTLIGTGTWAGRSRWGNALQTDDTTNDGASWPWSDRILSITNRHTVAWWGDASTLPDFAAFVSVPWRATGWTAPFASFQLTRDTATSELRYFFTPSGGSQRTADSDTGGIQTTDGLTLYGCSRNSSSWKFYRDGVQHGAEKTQTTNNLDNTAAVDWEDRQPPCVMNSSSTSPNSSPVGVGLLAAMWNRPLSAAEWRIFARDPYGLVRPARMFSTALAATTVNPTGQAITVTQGTPTVTATENPTVTPSGLAISLTQGTPGISIDGGATTVNLTGQVITFTQGTFNVRADVTWGPEGQAITVSQGTPTVAGGPITVQLTGQLITVAQGTPTVSIAGIAVSPVGQQITIRQGLIAFPSEGGRGQRGRRYIGSR